MTSNPNERRGCHVVYAVCWVGGFAIAYLAYSFVYLSFEWPLSAPMHQRAFFVVAVTFAALIVRVHFAIEGAERKTGGSDA